METIAVHDVEPSPTETGVERRTLADPDGKRLRGNRPVGYCWRPLR